jgi:hypothetical protein
MDGFYVAYEYGTGAAWAFVKAETADQVVDEIPELDVYETPPEWMTIDDLHQVRKHASVDMADSAGLDEVLAASSRLMAAAS